MVKPACDFDGCDKKSVVTWTLMLNRGRTDEFSLKVHACREHKPNMDRARRNALEAAKKVKES